MINACEPFKPAILQAPRNKLLESGVRGGAKGRAGEAGFLPGGKLTGAGEIKTITSAELASPSVSLNN